jgi:hypothetical protein
MVATVGVFVYTSTNAATESAAAVTGIDLISADNATNSLANRQANPVTCGANSYEKHLRLKMTVAPANACAAFKFWTDGTGQSNVALRAKLAVGTGGATPGTGDSTPSATSMTGDADAYTYTSGSKGNWDTGSYGTINHVTKAALLQLQPAAGATQGNWTQETLNYSYDET